MAGDVSESSPSIGINASRSRSWWGRGAPTSWSEQSSEVAQQQHALLLGYPVESERVPIEDSPGVEEFEICGPS